MSKLTSWKPLARGPVVTGPHDTSPQGMGLEDKGSDTEDNDGALSSSAQRFKRAVLKTVDLGKSVPARARSPSSPFKGTKGLLSMSGQGRTRPSANPADSSKASPSDGPSNLKVSTSSLGDDSPFIKPPSPTHTPLRPLLQSFRGVGSMRAGTQTLIQALQALPWAEDPDNETDPMSAQLGQVDSDGDDDVAHDPETPMSSSIHAIYRPVARFRRSEIKLPSASQTQGKLPVQPREESETEEGAGPSEDDAENDFEAATPRPEEAQRPAYIMSQSAASVKHLNYSRRVNVSCTGSMATVKLHRRARLAEKLREVFELDSIHEVLTEMPCWLLRSVLLQGYMYLTNSHICFFAHMPTREDQVLKSGALFKKATRTKRWSKHWFLLKNDALSWYQSSSDPYFVNGIIDLRYTLSCEPVGEKEIRIRTNEKSIHLAADSIPSRDEWVKAIKRVIFKAQNMGDTVKIAIPYTAVVDADKSSAMDFSETIEVKVIDKEEPYAVDSYFFAYFSDLSLALDQIRDAIRSYRTLSSVEHALLDTTSNRPTPVSPAIDRARSLPANDSKNSTGFRLASLLRPFHESLPSGKQNSVLEATPNEGTDEFTHITKREGSSFVPIETGGDGSLEPVRSVASISQTNASSRSGPTPTTHTYPPSTSMAELPLPLSRSTSNAAWNMGIPSWLKAPRKALVSSSSSTTIGPPDITTSPTSEVREMFSSTTQSEASQHDLGYSILEVPERVVDHNLTEKFRSSFAFDEKETLLGYFYGYIYRLLPLYGRLYVSTNYFCFKSSGPLSTKTRMILPIRDILAVETSKASRFGHHGLVVVIKGHEELFFEFGFEDRRTAFVTILQQQIEELRQRLTGPDLPNISQGHRDALVLEEFESKPSTNSEVCTEPSETLSESVPAVMFASTSSTFLTFKPKESLHFTFLTIGSRGDVQPYISLAKGLMQDGHRVRIATHGEFQDWIESHGIEFGFVGGDPAELMRICVENGTFTVAFLKEGLLKFRGWLDDLLRTSWEACQGTDVLVESPSAMGGIHIAEALQIPYFRAFTMTWTRTRAYPHAFAVPDRKMGGSYNYMTYVMFDQVFWRAISGQVNRWRRNVLHLPNTSLDRLEPHKVPFLYNFSPTLVPPPLDWPEWIHVTGNWFLDDADVSATKWTPPPDLLPFIDSAHAQGKKVVYIGFGSIVVSDPQAMTRCVIEAVVRSGVYAILSKGWSDRLHTKTAEASEPKEPLPPQIYSISSIPHDWLFQRIDAVCHHGGAGTTGASLRAGKPTIIRPFFGDQFFWADRVEALGIGTGVRKLTVEALTDALTSATTDIKQIDRARIIGEQIRSENGVATAIEAIYRDLDYARSLIKRTADRTLDDEPNVESPDQEQFPQPSQSLMDRSLSRSHRSSRGSHRKTPSEDWSVISDQEEPRSSPSSRRNSRRSSEGKIERSPTAKRTGLTAAVMSVLPSATHRRSGSTPSQSKPMVNP